VLAFFVETAVYNARQLDRKTEEGKAEPLDFLDFCCTVIQSYLMKYVHMPKTAE